MKRLIVLSAVLLGFCSAAAGQAPVLKKFEFSTAISYQSIKYDDDELDRSPKMWNIPFRVGFFVLPWLEVEPEVMLTKTTYFKSIPEPWSHLVSLNVSANFLRPNRAVPFILTGVGFGNGVPFMGQVSGSSEINSLAMNFGGGLKYFIIPSAALRVEYRFSHYWISYLSYSDESIRTYMDLHQILIGVSLAF